MNSRKENKSTHAASSVWVSLALALALAGQARATEVPLTHHFLPAPGPELTVRADVDRDGDMDLVSASIEEPAIAWYENDGSAPRSSSRRTIAREVRGIRSLLAADLDGDRDPDILWASDLDGTIAWSENGGGSPPRWAAHSLSASIAGPSSLFATDLDGDGDVDVLSASELDDRIAWYENNGAAKPSFTCHTITRSADGASSVFAADVDRDGDMDVLSASFFDDDIVWYESDGAKTPSFTAHTIFPAARGARSVYAADLDGDGDTDVLSSSHSGQRIAWYENDGARRPSFKPHTISGTADGASSVSAADLDGDDELPAWYENTTHAPSLGAHRRGAVR